MAVYFIRAGSDGPVKIGTADDVPARLRDLQVANAAELTLLRVLLGERFAEGWFHRHFADLRIRGEWFRFDPEMLTVEPPVCAPYSPEDHGRWAVIDGLGAVIGVTPQNRLKWRQRGVPHRYRLPIIYQARADGVAIDEVAFDRPPARQRAA